MQSKAIPRILILLDNDFCNMSLATKPLHPLFGKVIEDVNLDEVNENYLYSEIRELFEKHSCKSCQAFCLTAFSLERVVSPLALSTCSIKTSVVSPILTSAFWPGLENSFNGIRPSLLNLHQL